MQNERITQIIEIIDFQLETLRLIETPSQYNLSHWRDRTERALAGLILEKELTMFHNIVSMIYSTEKNLCEEFLEGLKRGIQKFPTMYLNPQEIIKAETKISLPNKKIDMFPKKVFIVHGHDDLVRVSVARFIEKMGIEVIILHEQPNKGKTIIEKFEQNAAMAGFAVVILTPDDLGRAVKDLAEVRPRARQNVVLELGYFIGSLGRDRVFILHKGNIEIPSDYLGVVYTELDDAGAWKFDLAKEMKLAGMEVDLNKL